MHVLHVVLGTPIKVINTLRGTDCYTIILSFVVYHRCWHNFVVYNILFIGDCILEEIIWFSFQHFVLFSDLFVDPSFQPEHWKLQWMCDERYYSARNRLSCINVELHLHINQMGQVERMGDFCAKIAAPTELVLRS